MHVVFTTLAFNQTRYFVALCRELEKSGISTSLISFHEDSNQYIKQAGIRCFNVFELGKKHEVDATKVDDLFEAIMTEYQIDFPKILLSHEKTTFNITNEEALKKRFIKYFRTIDEIIKLLIGEFGTDLIVFQELGGFASLLSTFYIARKLKLNHFFMEPSFFKGRMFFVKNSLMAVKPLEKGAILKDEVRNYLLKIKANKEIVIPKKDASHYRHPIFKILSGSNLKRLFQKLFSKYFLRRSEEFNHVGNFVYRHLRMLVNRLRFSRLYKAIPDTSFIYYPFHVPMDVALTVRAPLYLDQYSLIDYLARNIPEGYKLAIKEHPAMIGVVSYRRLIDLLKRNPNVVFLHPDINNHEVISKTELVVTVNSKTGAESLMQGKRVICLGDAIYIQANSVRYVENIQEVGPKIIEFLKEEPPSMDSVEGFFQAVWDEGYPGELYDCSPENILASAASIGECVKKLAMSY